MKHVKAFTYQPKIPAVLSGECTQTIRPLNQNGKFVNRGDEILFHGWEGSPYRSKWSWRLRVTVERKIVMAGTPDHMLLFNYDGDGWKKHRWNSAMANMIAKLDFIDPSTGTALKEVLEKMHGSLNGHHFQIIRWKPINQTKLSTQMNLEGMEAETEQDCCFYDNGKCGFQYRSHMKCSSLRECHRVFVSKNNDSYN